jgi:hypothetical protein
MVAGFHASYVEAEFVGNIKFISMMKTAGKRFRRM